MKEEKDQPDFLISWEATEFENKDRHPYWKVVVFVSLVLILAYGLFTDNFFLSIISILVGLLIYFFENKSPEVFKFGITDEGVFAQNQLYEYASLESFWVFFEPGGRKELSIKSQRSFMPYIRIPLGQANPSEVRRALTLFLEEEEQKETLTDSFEKFM